MITLRMPSRGTSDSNCRGNSEDRRRRREWLIKMCAERGRIPCFHCGKRMRIEPTVKEIAQLSFRTGQEIRQTLPFYTWEVDRYPLCGHAKHALCGPTGGKYLIGHEDMTLAQRHLLVAELRALLTQPKPTRHDQVKAQALMWRVGNIVPSCRKCNNTRCTTAKRCRGNALSPGGRVIRVAKMQVELKY